MLKAKIKAEALKTLLDAIYPLSSEIKLQSDEEGWHVCSVDPAHVALIDIRINKSAFTKFDSEYLELGVDLDKLKEILKLAGSGEEVSLSYNKDKHKLVFKVGKITRHMALLDSSGMGNPKIPNLDLSAKVTLPASELSRSLKAGSDVTDHVKIKAHEDYFQVVAMGDVDNVEMKIPKEEMEECTVEKECYSMFSLDYLQSMVNVAHGATPITLNLGQDHPLRIEFKFAEDAGSVTYMLAPRIEAD